MQELSSVEEDVERELAKIDLRRPTEPDLTELALEAAVVVAAFDEVDVEVTADVNAIPTAPFPWTSKSAMELSITKALFLAFASTAALYRDVISLHLFTYVIYEWNQKD